MSYCLLKLLYACGGYGTVFSVKWHWFGVAVTPGEKDTNTTLLSRTLIPRKPIFSFWNPLMNVLKAVYCGTLLGVILVGSSLKRAHTGIHTQPIQTGPPFPHLKDAPTTSHLAIRTNTHRRAPLWERVRRPRFTRTIRKHADVPSWPHRAGFQTLTRAVCGVGVWLIPPRMLQPHRSADGGLFLCVCEIIHNVLSRLNFNRGSVLRILPSPPDSGVFWGQ